MRKRKNIAQVKDSTKQNWSSITCFYGALIWLLFVTTSTCQAENEFEIASENVTCIYHDSKFTCDCNGRNQVMQLPLLSGGVNQVQITNCKTFIIHGNALNELEGLRKVKIDNVEHLQLQKYALTYSRYASGTPIIIEFNKVVLDSIDSHAFNGNIEEISFNGGRIDTIHPFAFTTLKERASLIKMEGVWFGEIKAQAFKRFSIENLELKNCVFESNVPSKAFYELEVHGTLSINNVRFREVFTEAFLFKRVSKLFITHNVFDKVHAAWIEAQVLESVVFRDNIFGGVNTISFNGLTLHRDYTGSEQLELHFINNKVRFENGSPLALEFNKRFMLDIKNLQYDNSYACKDLNNNEKPPQPKHEFFRKFIDQIYFRTGETTVTSSNQHAANHEKPNENQSFVVLAKLIESNCRPRSYLLYILLGVFGLILLLVLIAILVYCKWSQNKRRKMDVVMPEPRTYKETQIVYQIENAGLLKTDL